MLLRPSGAVLRLDNEKNALLYPDITWSDGGLDADQKPAGPAGIPPGSGGTVMPASIGAASGHGIGMCLPSWMASCFGPTLAMDDDSNEGLDDDDDDGKPGEVAAGKKSLTEGLRTTPGRSWWRGVLDGEVTAPTELRPLYLAIDSLAMEQLGG